MASIYARGNVLWMKFKNKDGKAECRSSGYRVGQEALARELAEETERQSKQERGRAAPSPRPRAPSSVSWVLPLPSVASSAPVASRAPVAPAVALAERIGPDAPEGVLTVRAYAEEWLRRRLGIMTVKDEATRLRLHVFPLIGHMALAEVRPRHIRDLINAIKQKTSDAPCCKGELLAPRTVRLVFATVRLVFKSAVIDEHIASNPVVLEPGILPKNVDKDPEWRSTAIFERDELIAVISDTRIAPYRRVFYGLEGIAGVRHSEAAALRWRDYNARCEPLGKLTVSRSGEKKRTKTQLSREIPIHPTLAMILDEWKTRGWAEKYGRAPIADDLILPTEDNKVRKASNTLKEFHKDLERIGLRPRRSHDLRRTFVTLARVDGGRSDVLRPLTHPGEKDIIGLYTTFPWPVVCGEIQKLRLPLPSTAATAAEAPLVEDPSSTMAPPAAAPPADHENDGDEIAGGPHDPVAGYSPSYTPDGNSEIRSNSNRLSGVAQVGQRITKPLLYP